MQQSMDGWSVKPSQQQALNSTFKPWQQQAHLNLQLLLLPLRHRAKVIKCFAAYSHSTKHEQLVSKTLAAAGAHLNLQLLLLPLRHRAKVIQRQQVDMIQTRLHGEGKNASRSVSTNTLHEEAVTALADCGNGCG
eukprot:1161747-Pelagomonas_calceolata.AAC.4